MTASSFLVPLRPVPSFHSNRWADPGLVNGDEALWGATSALACLVRGARFDREGVDEFSAHDRVPLVTVSAPCLDSGPTEPQTDLGSCTQDVLCVAVEVKRHLSERAHLSASVHETLRGTKRVLPTVNPTFTHSSAPQPKSSAKQTLQSLFSPRAGPVPDHGHHCATAAPLPSPWLTFPSFNPGHLVLPM